MLRRARAHLASIPPPHLHACSSAPQPRRLARAQGGGRAAGAAVRLGGPHRQRGGAAGARATPRLQPQVGCAREGWWGRQPGDGGACSTSLLRESPGAQLWALAAPESFLGSAFQAADSSSPREARCCWSPLHAALACRGMPEWADEGSDPHRGPVTAADIEAERQRMQAQWKAERAAAREGRDPSDLRAAGGRRGRDDDVSQRGGGCWAGSGACTACAASGWHRGLLVCLLATPDRAPCANVHSAAGALCRRAAPPSWRRSWRTTISTAGRAPRTSAPPGRCRPRRRRPAAKRVSGGGEQPCCGMRSVLLAALSRLGGSCSAGHARAALPRACVKESAGPGTRSCAEPTQR